MGIQIHNLVGVFHFLRLVRQKGNPTDFDTRRLYESTRQLGVQASCELLFVGEEMPHAELLKSLESLARERLDVSAVLIDTDPMLARYLRDASPILRDLVAPVPSGTIALQRQLLHQIGEWASQAQNGGVYPSVVNLAAAVEKQVQIVRVANPAKWIVEPTFDRQLGPSDQSIGPLDAMFIAPGATPNPQLLTRVARQSKVLLGGFGEIDCLGRRSLPQVILDIVLQLASLSSMAMREELDRFPILEGLLETAIWIWLKKTGVTALVGDELMQGRVVTADQLFRGIPTSRPRRRFERVSQKELPRHLRKLLIEIDFVFPPSIQGFPNSVRQADGFGPKMFP